MIGIIGAMPEEIQEIKSQIQHVEIINHHPRTFFKGMIHNQEVVLVLAGIGKTNAAITTSLLIELFDITAIVNIGVAGGQNGAKHNDVIVSTSVLYHDVDVSKFGKYVPGQVPGHDPEFIADNHLVELSIQVLEQQHIPYKKGRIASGDQFVYSTKTVVAINQLYPDVYAIEMEAAAIAHTASIYNIPFVIFRSISDVLDDPTQHEDFQTFLLSATKQASTLLLELLRVI